MGEQGWHLSGLPPRGFPRIERASGALVDGWKSRMENAQLTHQYHRFNTRQKRKVLTERQVVLRCCDKRRSTNGGAQYGIRRCDALDLALVACEYQCCLQELQKQHSALISDNTARDWLLDRLPHTSQDCSHLQRSILAHVLRDIHKHTGPTERVRATISHIDYRLNRSGKPVLFFLLNWGERSIGERGFFRAIVHGSCYGDYILHMESGILEQSGFEHG